VVVSHDQKAIARGDPEVVVRIRKEKLHILDERAAVVFHLQQALAGKASKETTSQKDRPFAVGGHGAGAIRQRTFSRAKTQHRVIAKVIDTPWSNDPNATLVILEDRKNMTVAESIGEVEVIQPAARKPVNTLVGGSNPKRAISLRKKE
jgi:hypothetical protein